MSEDQKLQVGFGRFNLTTQGISTIIVIILLANIFVVLWAGRTVLKEIRSLHQSITVDGDARSAEHHNLKNELDRLMCLNTLSKEDQQTFRQSPGNWKKWCWWVEENGGKK